MIPEGSRGQLVHCLSDPIEKARFPPTIMLLFKSWWVQSMVSRKNKNKIGKINDPFGENFENLKYLELIGNEGQVEVEPFGDPKMYFSPLISYEPVDSSNMSSWRNNSNFEKYVENRKNVDDGNDNNNFNSNNDSDDDNDSDDNINYDGDQNVEDKSNGELRVRLLFQNSHFSSQPDGSCLKEKDRRTGNGSLIELAESEFIHFIGKVTFFFLFPI